MTPNQQLGKQLVDAAFAQAWDTAKFFLQLPGTDVNIPCDESDGDTTLMFAVCYQQMDMVYVLIKKGANVNARNKEGESALHYVQGGDIETMRLLLYAGANPNFETRSGYTPLMKSVSRGETDMVRLLLEHGANVNDVENGYGQSPLMLSINRFARPELQYAYQEIAKLLIAHGADLHHKANNILSHMTALESAKHDGLHDMVKLLEDAGAKE